MLASVTPETSAHTEAASDNPDSSLNYLNKIMSGLNNFGSSDSWRFHIMEKLTAD